VDGGGGVVLAGLHSDTQHVSSRHFHLRSRRERFFSTKTKTSPQIRYLPNGIRRCCFEPVILGTEGYGTGLHKIKASVAACRWNLTFVIWGNLRAGLVDKRLPRDDILEEYSKIMSIEAHLTVGWLTRLQTSKLIKLLSWNILEGPDSYWHPSIGWNLRVREENSGKVG
jgi:hypothetical protein